MAVDPYQDVIDAAAALQPSTPASATPTGGQADPYQDVIDAANALQAPQPAPTPQSQDRGFLDALFRKVGNGAAFGAGPAVDAGLTTALSKVPWLRDMAAKVPGIDPSVANPDISYDQRRQAAQKAQEDASKYHPVVSTFGELAGNTLATLATPEVEAMQAASPFVRGAVAGGTYGGAQGYGEGLSEGKGVGDSLANAGRSAIAGAVTGGALEGVAGKLLKEAPEKTDAWIVKDIVGHDRGTQPASATLKKQLAKDADDVRALVNANPDLKTAIDKAADGKADALHDLQQTISQKLEAELAPRLGRYGVIDEASEHGGVRVGDLDDAIEDAIKQQDVGDAPVEQSLKFWRDRIKDKWGSTDTVKIDPKAELSPGFSVSKALDNYRARLAEAAPEEKPAIEATIKDLENKFGTTERTYDPNAVVPTTRLRRLVTDLQTDLANAMGGLDEKTRYQKLKEVQKPVWDFLDKHLDDVAKRLPEAATAVDEIRKSNNRLSALLNMQKVADARVNRATSNAMAGMRPAFGIRGAIHQAVGGGLPGVAVAAGLGHPAVAAGLGITTVLPSVKRSTDKALAALIRRASTGSVPANIVEEAIAAGVPRALATQIASSAQKGAVNNVQRHIRKDL
jgi:hypothetical protein